MARIRGGTSLYPTLSAARLSGRNGHRRNTTVAVGAAVFGSRRLAVVAGPCAVETRAMTIEVARAVKAAGATLLRGGAFKPRTSPYSFHGLGEEGLRYLAEARELTGLPIASEVLDVRQLDTVARYADMIQIGARNMQNYALLREVGRLRRPVLLKRGYSATLDELLLAAEYILCEGNPHVVLCERGIRAFDTRTRFTLDLSAVPLLKGLTHLPVIVDPSHAAGRADLVGALARAAVAVGADGVMIEVHPHPIRALSDGPQQLTPRMFAGMMAELRGIARAVGRLL